jgi:hypothetical protein
MENKDIQAYLKHNQYIQANLDGMELPENFDPQTYEAHYEMSIKDQRKLPNYVFNFTLPNDIGKRRQKDSNSPASVPSTVDLNQWTCSDFQFHDRLSQERQSPLATQSVATPHSHRRASFDSIRWPGQLPGGMTGAYSTRTIHSRHFNKINVKPDKKNLFEHQKKNVIRHAQSEYLTSGHSTLTSAPSMTNYSLHDINSPFAPRATPLCAHKTREKILAVILRENRKILRC